MDTRNTASVARRPQEIPDFEQELSLNEVEGRTIEATRLWTLAQVDPRVRARLIALDDLLYVIENSYHKNNESALVEAASDIGLSAKETLAIQVIGRYIRRRIKRDARQRKAEKRQVEAETDKGETG